jgi:SAM-dependent methyltransferase
VPKAYRDIFKSTAWYYARYRPRYSAAFFDHLVDVFRLDGQGCLLDLGCGTGQLTIPLARHVERAVGLDPEPEMLAEARLQAVREGVANVVWMAAGSEDLDALRPGLGRFRLVTMGNSFQWMDRARTLHALAGLLVPGGGIVVAADGRPAGTVPPARPTWNAAVHRVLHRRLGDTRRADGAADAHPGEPDEAVIRRAGFTRIETYRHVYHSRWDVEHIIGYLSSTSFASPAVLGAQRDAIEQEVRAALLALQPSGVYEADIAIEAILAWRD